MRYLLENERGEKMQSFDYIVIGGGSGGIASANRAALHGAKVLLIEGRYLGGTCVNVGCVPKKVMWQGSELFHQMMTETKAYGFDVTSQDFDFSTFVANRDNYIQRLRQLYQQGLDQNGVQVVFGLARLKNQQEVVVNGESYIGKHILLATGGAPVIPEIPGAEYGLTSNDFFDMRELPKKVAIIGSGYVAVELAGVLSHFQVETHLIYRHDHVLRSFDRETVSHLEELYRKEGLHLHPYQEVQSVKKQSQGYQLNLSDGSFLQVDLFIWAVGRKPMTDSLGLETTGVRVNEQGYIQVDEYQNTKVAGIYALGDLTCQPHLTPVAIKEGRQLSERLFNHQVDAKADLTYVPTVVFSHPPLGTVGLSEEEARQKYPDELITVYTSQFNPMRYALLSHKLPAFFKLVCVGKKEQVIGLHGVGEGMDELLQGFAVAMGLGATKADFDRTIAIHPTAAEEFVTMTRKKD